MKSTEQLMEQAQEQTSLHDFGDPSFRTGLDILVRSLDTEANLNALGDLVLEAVITKTLVNRLQIEEWYRLHPETAAEVITAPLIGIGLPRTGSTAVSNLLGEDPGARSLLIWESATPVPPPATVTGRDPRIEASIAQQQMQQQTSPRMAALVPQSPTGPFECQEMMALTFTSQYFLAFATIPTYAEWLMEADLVATYAYERRTLQLLQYGQDRRRPWRLKCPSHLLWLDDLDAVFPDARYVMTHRDPTEVIVSVCDVYQELAQNLTDSLDRHAIGQLNVRQWALGMDRFLAFRDAKASDRIYDMNFRAVQRDPIGEIRKLYDWLGEPVSAEFEAGMARWWQAHAAARELNVHPEPATFGLDLDAVRQRFAAYTAHIPEWTGAPG